MAFKNKVSGSWAHGLMENQVHCGAWLILEPSWEAE